MKPTLTRWSTRLNLAQAGHYAATERYHRIDNIVGIPLIVLSTFVSVFLFLDNPNYILDIIIKISGVLVAILASVQTYIKPSEKAQMHRVKASKYGSLKREIDSFLILATNEDDANAFIKNLVSRWNAIADDAPVTPDSIRKKAHCLLDTATESNGA